MSDTPRALGPPTDTGPESDPWPPLPDPIPGNPYWDFEFDEADYYCHWCGNAEWKFHAPWCKWADAVEKLLDRPLVKGERRLVGGWMMRDE